jgi:hypothetical protein
VLALDDVAGIADLIVAATGATASGAPTSPLSPLAGRG